MVRTLLGVALVAAFAGSARGELKPEQVAVIGSQASAQSRELAKYYAKQRQIPAKNILLLDVASGEVLPRAKWDAEVRPAIRRWLQQEGRDTGIRCLVTVWDVPLKIGPVDLKSPPFSEVLKNLDTQARTRREQIVRLVGDVDTILAPMQKEARTAPAADASAREYAEWLETALKAAQTRAKEIKQANPAGFSQAAGRLEHFYHRGGGSVALMRALQQQVEGNVLAAPELVNNLNLRRGEYVAYRNSLSALSALPETAERDQQVLSVLQQSDGLPSTVAWVEQQRELWEKNETYSSFDSELSLIHFSQHPLLRWYPNMQHYGFNAAVAGGFPPTLMVARLEAPTFEKTKRLVDTAIAIEKNGLAGKVYLDARGLAPDKSPGSYGDYDQSLRELASFLKKNTKLDVVFNDEDKLFQKGDCPNAALYCGWYSLSSYVDAFEWRPGSVGYHIASGEAKTLRGASSNVWCKRMLDEGVCATLGPVYEPYLTAFPRPLDFFPMLLAGKHTLVEVYARTNPSTSWTMVLVGDPLYSPFRNNPALDVEKLPPQLR